MHRAFAAWLIAKSWRAPLAGAIFGILSPQGLSPFSVVAGAVGVFLLLSRDLRSGLQSALTGCAAVVTLLATGGQSAWSSIAIVGLLFLAPFGLAVVMQRTGSLRWCFQIAVVGATALVIGIYVVLDDATGSWRLLAGEWGHMFADELRRAGYAMEDKTIVDLLAGTNWGTYVADWMLTMLCAVFLGCWWHSLLHAPGAFGKEFQQLRLGKAFGSLALMIVIATLVLNTYYANVPLMDALRWIAIFALAIQGLSAVHRLKASGRVGRGWLTATYVLLIVPITMVFVVMLLAGWGVADNWRRPA